jgi:hypothetical protein
MVYSILSLSIYGDDHVIGNTSKYNCHALMITLWQLYVLKYIVERSTHMCLLVSPSCEDSVIFPPRRTSPFLPPDKGCFLHLMHAKCMHKLCSLLMHIRIY